MELRYKTSKIEKQCTEVSAAKKLFGGNTALVTSLLTRVIALRQAPCLKDIIVQPQFRFHKLQGNREGTYAIDVKTIRDPWRLVLRPLDPEENPYDGNIDEICELVEIVRIEEVSKHYE